MRRRYARAGARILAGVVCLTLLFDLLLKSSADLQQAMWACYWASGAILVGVVSGWNRPLACGAVFFAGIGLPAWLLGLLFGRPIYTTSVLIHTVPLAAGLLYLTEMRELPKYTALGSWLIYVVSFVLAWFFCSPSAMINLSHLSASLLPGFFPSFWQFYAASILLSGISVKFVTILFNRVLRNRAGFDHTDK